MEGLLSAIFKLSVSGLIIHLSKLNIDNYYYYGLIIVS